MTFGEALIQIMDEKGMSPSELAARSGVRKQTINELIKGRSKEPTFTKSSDDDLSPRFIWPFSVSIGLIWSDLYV